MTEQNPESQSNRFDPLSFAWRLLGAPQTLALLLTLLAVMLILGTMIPQIPSQEVGDPQAWLAVQTGFLGQKNGIIQVLRLYDLYHTPWFQGLLALLAIVFFVSAVDSAELAWRAARRSPWPLRVLVEDTDAWHELGAVPDLSEEQVLDRLRGSLEQGSYSIGEVGAVAGTSLVTTWRPRFLWLRPSMFGLLLVALVALLVFDTFGWQGETWQPNVDEVRAVGYGTPYRVRLDAFGPDTQKPTAACSYQSELAWLEDKEIVAQGIASCTKPAYFRGLAVRQITVVPRVLVRGTDSLGQSVTLQAGGGEALLPGRVDLVFPELGAQGLVLIPSRSMNLVVTFTSFDRQGGVELLVEKLEDGGAQRVPLTVMRNGGTLTVQDVDLDMMVRYEPVLRIDYRPGAGFVVGAMALALMLLLAYLLALPGVAWVVVDGDTEAAAGVHVALVAGTGSDRWLAHLSQELEKGLSNGV